MDFANVFFHIAFSKRIQEYANEMKTLNVSTEPIQYQESGEIGKTVQMNAIFPFKSVKRLLMLFIFALYVLCVCVDALTQVFSAFPILFGSVKPSVEQ